MPRRMRLRTRFLCEAVRLTWGARLLLSLPMSRCHPVGVLVVLQAIAAFAVLSVGCSGNPVGRLCDLGEANAATEEVVVASQSLDCVSRTCLRVPKNRDLPPGSGPTGDSGLCTAECSSDGDCDRVPESPCATGFACGVAVTVGPFCCRKLCICRDYIVIPESGSLATPKACDASLAENACCNLPDRTNNAAYPLCKG